MIDGAFRFLFKYPLVVFQQGDFALGVSRPIVLALPRGGVPVGFEVAKALAAPLDVLLVRKIGAPGHEELGLGAVGRRS